MTDIKISKKNQQKIDQQKFDGEYGLETTGLGNERKFRPFKQIGKYRIRKGKNYWFGANYDLRGCDDVKVLKEEIKCLNNAIEHTQDKQYRYVNNQKKIAKELKTQLFFYRTEVEQKLEDKNEEIETLTKKYKREKKYSTETLVKLGVFTGLEEFRNWADAKSEMMAKIAESDEEVRTYKLALIDERAVCDEWQIRAQKAEKILAVFNVAKDFVNKK